MSWFRTITFLIFTIINTSESRHGHHHHQKKPSALVVGTVYCDSCFHHNLPRASQFFIAGASVMIECTDTRPGTSFRQQVKTDSHGEFKVHLPFPVDKHTRRIRGCSVKLLSSNKPYCSIAASATSSNLHLKSRKDGMHIFSAGFFTFKPQVCDEKEKLRGIKTISQFSNPNDPAFVPPVQDPPSLGSFLPPLPRLPPLPTLPRLPPLPGLPFLPPLVPKQQPANNVPKLAENLPDPFPFTFPPNPFNLPSLIFPPNPPLLPLPLPPVLPPLFPTPNLPPLLNLPPLPPLPLLPPLPPIPGLTPSPPPPPPPAPIQLPPFPFQPTPGFPGAPPAEVSAPSEKTSP